MLLKTRNLELMALIYSLSFLGHVKDDSKSRREVEHILHTSGVDSVVLNGFVLLQQSFVILSQNSRKNKIKFLFCCLSQTEDLRGRDMTISFQLVLPILVCFAVEMKVHYCISFVSHQYPVDLFKYQA